MFFSQRQARRAAQSVRQTQRKKCCAARCLLNRLASRSVVHTTDDSFVGPELLATAIAASIVRGVLYRVLDIE